VVRGGRCLPSETVARAVLRGPEPAREQPTRLDLTRKEVDAADILYGRSGRRATRRALRGPLTVPHPHHWRE